MKKIKIKVLKNFEASPDGIKTISLKAGEILELGTPKLTPHLLGWFERNSSFGEFFLDEEKSIVTAPDNKMLEPELKNKSLELPIETEEEAKDENKKNNKKGRK